MILIRQSPLITRRAKITNATVIFIAAIIENTDIYHVRIGDLITDGSQVIAQFARPVAKTDWISQSNFEHDVSRWRR